MRAVLHTAMDAKSVPRHISALVEAMAGPLALQTADLPALP
jgi:hypothetical protein